MPAPIYVSSEEEKQKLINDWKKANVYDPNDEDDALFLSNYSSSIVVGSGAEPIAPLVPEPVEQPTQPIDRTPSMENEPVEEPITAGLGELYTPNLPKPSSAVIREDRERIKEDEKARIEEYQDLYPFLTKETIRERVRAESAERSRSLMSAGSRDVRYTSTAIPLEYRKDYDPTNSGFIDAFSRQTSIGVDPEKSSRALISSLPPSNDPVDVANREAMVVLNDWLLANEPSYATATPDQKREMLASTVLGLRAPSSIKEPGVGAGGSAAEDEATVFGRQENQGNVPDYSPAQIAYLKEQRASLTRSVGANAANELLGDPQWYEDSELKRQRLAADPQFEGLLGLGVYRYPSGAVVESTPMWALRMIAAPANFVVGGAVGLYEHGMERAFPGTGPIIQRGRERSEISPAGRSAGELMPSPISIAFDNVKRNRGATEEIYDFGVMAGAENRIIKTGLFLTGLGIDVLAIPILPGAGVISRAGKGARLGYELATAATKEGKGATRAAIAGAGLVGASYGTVKGGVGGVIDYGRGIARDVGSIASIPGAIARTVSPRALTNIVSSVTSKASNALPSLSTAASKAGDALVAHLPQWARSMGNWLEAPGDIRMLKAADYMANPAEAPEALRIALKENEELLGKAAAGDVTVLTDRRLGRWLQMTVAANPDLVKGINPGSFRELVDAVLKSPEGLAEVTSVARLESTVAHVLKESPNDAGTLYLLTNRTAVSSPKVANTILEEAGKHPITKAVQTALAESNVESLTTIRNWLETSSTLRGINTFRYDEIAAKLDSLVETGSKLDGQTGRAIIELVTDGIALSGKYGNVASTSNLGNLSIKAQEALTVPIEVRPSWLREKIKGWVFDSLGDGPPTLSKGVHSPAVIEAVNRLQQELAALPQILNKEINEGLKMAGKSPHDSLARGEIIRNTVTDIIGIKGGSIVAESIKRIAVYNKPDFFFQNVFASIIKKESSVLKDPVVLKAFSDLDAKLVGDLNSVPLGKITTEVAVQNYLKGARDLVSSRGLGVSIIKDDSINELLTAVIYDARASAFQQNVLYHVADMTGTSVPRAFLERLGLDNSSATKLIVEIIISKLGKKTKGSYLDLVFERLVKKPNELADSLLPGKSLSVQAKIGIFDAAAAKKALAKAELPKEKALRESSVMEARKKVLAAREAAKEATAARETAMKAKARLKEASRAARLNYDSELKAAKAAAKEAEIEARLAAKTTGTKPAKRILSTGKPVKLTEEAKLAKRQAEAETRLAAKEAEKQARFVVVKGAVGEETELAANLLKDFEMKKAIADTKILEAEKARQTRDKFLEVYLKDQAAASQELGDFTVATIRAAYLAETDVEIYRAWKALEDAADDIIDAQELRKLIPLKAAEDLVSDLEDLQKLWEANNIVVHPQAAAFISGLKDGSYDFNKLIDYVRSNPKDGGMINWASSIIKGVQKIQYWFMLSVRTRFHGMNFLTAPFIISSTIGSNKAAGAMANLGSGFYLSRMLESKSASRPILFSNTDSARDATIALKTPGGKSYSWNDLADLAVHNGIRQSLAGFSGGEEAINSLAKYLEAKQKGLPETWPTLVGRVLIEGPRDFASLSDGAWRSAVLIDALKAGRPEMEAVQLARESLFDYGRMTDWERKYISSWFMYYSFTRASLANALAVLLENPSRLANQIKASKGYNVFGEDEPGSNQRSIFYESGFMQTRPWMGSSTKGEGKQNFGYYAPPLPLVDSYVFLAKLVGTAASLMPFTASTRGMDLDPGEFMMSRTNPFIQIAVTDNIDRIYGGGFIDSRHIAWLKATGSWRLFTSLVGEPSLVEAKPGEAVWVVRDDGKTKLTYTFRGNPDAIKNYKRLIGAANLMGGTLMLADYAPIMSNWSDVVEPGVALDKPLFSPRGIGHFAGIATTATQEDPSVTIERNRKETWSEMKKRDR